MNMKTKGLLGVLFFIMCMTLSVTIAFVGCTPTADTTPTELFYGLTWNSTEEDLREAISVTYVEMQNPNMLYTINPTTIYGIQVKGSCLFVEGSLKNFTFSTEDLESTSQSYVRAFTEISALYGQPANYSDTIATWENREFTVMLVQGSQKIAITISEKES